ncbi:MAG: hypothetical protein AAB477_00570 [Patescibacteria group bacterium]|mgnify:CR=1 FL=1
MKQIIHFLLAVVTITATTSCFSVKKGQKSKPGIAVDSTSTVNSDYTVLNQSHVDDGQLTDIDLDSMTYFLSGQVNIQKTTLEKSKSIGGGALVITERSRNIVRTIPAYQVGTFVDVQRDEKNPDLVDYLKISFDIDDEIFEVWFSRNGDGSYSPFPDEDQKNQGYSMNVVGECKLLIYYKKKTQPVSDKKVAQGNTGGSSVTPTAPAKPNNKGNLPPLKKN